MRRAEALHPAALLVDQNRRVGAAHGRTKISDQRATCVGRLDIALEEDEAPRLRLAQERTLLGVIAVQAMKARAGIDGH